MAVSRAIADNGLPLKIEAEWTDDDYWNRKYPDSDEMECVNVAGWLIRINGKKYPRQLGEDDIDWSYRNGRCHIRTPFLVSSLNVCFTTTCKRSGGPKRSSAGQISPPRQVVERLSCFPDF